MSAGRMKARRRKLALLASVDTTDAAALVTWGRGFAPLAAQLRELALEATDRPIRRTHSRLHLRRTMLKALREMDNRLAVVAAPPAP